MRKWLHGELEALGYNLLEAGDGVDALVIAELPSPIDIVGTGVVMPRVDGPAFVKSPAGIAPGCQGALHFRDTQICLSVSL